MFKTNFMGTINLWGTKIWWVTAPNSLRGYGPVDMTRPGTGIEVSLLNLRSSC